MMILYHSRFAPHCMHQVLQAHQSPDAPPWPADAQQHAAIVYGDQEGYHVLYLYEADDAKTAHLLNAAVTRGMFFETRVPGLNVVVRPAMSVEAVVRLAQQQLPR